MSKLTLIVLLIFCSSELLIGQNKTESTFAEGQAVMKMSQGKQYLKDYRYGKAMDKFTEAIELDAKGEYYVQRAEALLELDKIDKAREDYFLAVKADTALGLAYLGLAKWYIAMDQNNDSLQWYIDKALHYSKKREDQAVALTTLAELKVFEGEYDLAKKYITAALKLDEKNVHSSLVYASVLFELEDHQDEAIEILEEVQEKNSNNLRFIINLGYMYNKVERYDEAMKILQKGLYYEEDNPYVLANLAYSLYRKGRISDAHKVVDKSIKNDQSNAYGHYVKGLLTLETKNIPKACKCFNRAIDRAPINHDRSFEEIKKAVTDHCDNPKKI